MQKILCMLFFVWSGILYAQTSEKYNSVYASFYEAEDLFLKGQYGAAREEFNIFMKTFTRTNDPFYIKARYYEGLSALELFQNDAIKLLEKFNLEYPESIYRNLIILKKLYH